MNLVTPMFEFFAQEEKVQAETKKENDLADEVKRHWESLRLCWPEWKGPKVDPESIDGYCEVNRPIVYSITHNKNRYHYMAPCRIDKISDDMMELEVTIDYKEDSTCNHYNGERLKLHITEVWAPVYRINKFYKTTQKP